MSRYPNVFSSLSCSIVWARKQFEDPADQIVSRCLIAVHRGRECGGERITAASLAAVCPNNGSFSPRCDLRNPRRRARQPWFGLGANQSSSALRPATTALPSVLTLARSIVASPARNEMGEGPAF
jgi:hypothetical protein